MFSSLAVAALLATGAAAASVQPSQPQPAEAGAPIVVTGIRPEQARAGLEACLARRCPPMEDIAASLQYAEALFVNGDYRDAASVLRRSIGRNRGAGDELPIAVAGLYRAHARVSIHSGDGDAYRRSTWTSARILEDGLGENDPQVLGARLETAGMHVSLGEAAAAEALYRDVAERARAIGRPDIEAIAELRRGWLDHQRGRSSGRERIARVMNSTDPRTRVQQYAARILLARLDREAGNFDSSERLVAELAQAGFGVPVLVYAPPIEVTDRPPGARNGMGEAARYNAVDLESGGRLDFWADVGFWVTPEGRVEEAEVLRSHGEAYWLEPVLGSIRRRVYAPAGTAGAEPSYRIERFSYTSLLQARTGSRIARQSSGARIESIDLSAETAPAGQP